MIVVSDTSPIHYLVLCGVESVLPRLFREVVVPDAVVRELSHHAAPEAVRRLVARAPDWLVVRSPSAIDPGLPKLGRGETQAICLALELKAELLLTDDKQARRAAEARAIACTGTVGVIQRAAELGILDFDQVMGRLRAASLRLPTGLAEQWQR